MSLCPEAAKRAAMTDAEFWDHVFNDPEPGGTSAYDPEDWKHEAVDERLTADPCPECGAAGACSWDIEGRPLIHALPEPPPT